MGCCKSKPVVEREDGQDGHEMNPRPHEDVFAPVISAPIPTGNNGQAAPNPFHYAMAVPTTTGYPIIFEHPAEHVGQAVTTVGATAHGAHGASPARGNAGTNAAAATQQRAGSTSSSGEGEAAGQGAAGNANTKPGN
ncbi:hypothetical protein ACJ41O_001974 [Fusarium nematophilum]